MEEPAVDADDQRLLDGDSEAALLPDTPFILDEFGEEMTAVLTPVSIWSVPPARCACAWLTQRVRSQHGAHCHFCALVQWRP